MFQAELDEYSVDRANLHAASTAGVSDFSSFDVVFTIRLEEPQRCKPLDQLTARFGPREALQQFLKNQASRKDLIGAFQRVLECLDFRQRCVGVASEGKRPNAGIDKQAQGLRARSAL